MSAFSARCALIARPAAKCPTYIGYRFWRGVTGRSSQARSGTGNRNPIRTNKARPVSFTVRVSLTRTGSSGAETRTQ